MRRPGAGLRFWAAVFLAVCAVLGGWAVLTRDIDWPTRNRSARLRGRAAEHAGNFPLARDAYESALVNNPYDWETRLRLADLLNTRLAERDAALRHYLHALAYSQDASIAPETEAKVRILRLLRSGELEEPSSAVADMFAAAELEAEGLFRERLAVVPESAWSAHWDAWRERGRGVVTRSRVEAGRHGLFDALVELEYPDGTAMSMHLRCSLRSIWKVSLSFP